MLRCLTRLSQTLMKKQIKRVSIMQSSKVVALTYPIFGLIHTAIGIVSDPTFGRNQFHLYPIKWNIRLGLYLQHQSIQ